MFVSRLSTPIGELTLIASDTALTGVAFPSWRHRPARARRDTMSEVLGRAKEARAVGAANGKNPIPIIVPCHRVIGANGDLTGFGGGIERKRWLLQREGALLL